MNYLFVVFQLLREIANDKRILGNLNELQSLYSISIDKENALIGLNSMIIARVIYNLYFCCFKIHQKRIN